ncbi:DUF5412 family protein [Priestia taiwanensis]|uniref:DUF5412 domain-containing protein n=1 Tax=Priestia taiwanensis TaxID=1347902 RepID=A0A917EMP6_9BACI|nr:DUF5412 family protein [Priestia taiwanensis]MBM7362619.1 hypothetical protein [Priestia taiwanensis]GGE63722.1 hypothetical protein GCM10007140_12440 [Priestia taiwanensis]
MITNLIENKKQHKKRGSLLISILFISVLLITLGGYSIHSLFLNMERLKTGEYLTEKTSPDGKYTVKAYISNGGATTAFSIRGELVFNKKNGKTKNIYWGYQEDIANIKWLDGDTVVINNRTLNVPKGKHDFRNN